LNQRINDGVHRFVFAFCRGRVFLFLARRDWRWRITAIMANAASPRNVAMPPLARICSRCERARIVFRAVSNCPRMPPVAFDATDRFDGCCRGTPGGRRRDRQSAILTTDQTDRLSQRPLICAVKFFDIENRPFEDSTNHAARGPWVPSPSHRRCQSDDAASAGPGGAVDWRRLPQDEITLVAA